MNRNAPFPPLAWIGENLVRVLGELRLLAGWSTSVDHLLMPLAALFFGRFHRSMEQLNLLLEQFRQGTLPLPQSPPRRAAIPRARRRRNRPDPGQRCAPTPASPNCAALRPRCLWPGCARRSANLFPPQPRRRHLHGANPRLIRVHPASPGTRSVIPRHGGSRKTVLLSQRETRAIFVTIW